jgi:hypothetical protein
MTRVCIVIAAEVCDLGVEERRRRGRAKCGDVLAA